MEYTLGTISEGNRQVASRLDRFLISKSIVLQNLDMEATILPIGGSNHWPIQLHFTNMNKPQNRPFRFESFWIDHPTFMQNIESWWTQTSVKSDNIMYIFQQKLKIIKAKLKCWNKNTFGNIFQAKKELEEKMADLQQTMIKDGPNKERLAQESNLQKQWEDRLIQEEQLWKQKSRVQWLKHGERNTSFFHKSTIQHRANNRILSLKKDDGAKVSTREKIGSELNLYFRSLLTEPNQDRTQAINKIISAIPPLVTEEQKSLLLREFIEQEIEEVVFTMATDKAPGPDGFTIEFFKACWHIIKADPFKLIKNFHKTKRVLSAINATFLTLIPKSDHADSPDKFRPIALCNVIYKILSKLMANGLKPILPSIISQEQSGYVEGRQITDSIILSQEVLHSIKTQKIPGMIIQLDLSKAFDKISWTYIREILQAFGFNQIWINWIMELVSGAFFSIMLNGGPLQPFLPSRGISQGDPLSPFLFVIMAEGLGRSISQEIQTNQLKGIKAMHQGPIVTHQQFVDDTMLMGTPTIKEAQTFNKVLSTFSDASGMEINLTKSKLFFFNTSIPVQRNLNKILKIQRNSLPTKYLGIPLSEHAPKAANWEDLLNKMKARLSGWTHRALNMASRLVLVKSVLQTMPAYMLSALAAPKSVYKSIWNIQRSFLWNGDSKKCKWALLKWTEICKPKLAGGLDLRDPEILSKAIQQKSGGDGWRILTPYGATCGKQSTQIKYRTKTSSGSLAALKAPPSGTKEQWPTQDNNGNTDHLLQHLDQRRILTSTREDILRWGNNPKGTFNLKEAYRIIVASPDWQPNPRWHALWTKGTWPKITLFSWLVLHNRALTWNNLQRRGFIGPSRCALYENNEEMLNHILNTCPTACALWDDTAFIFKQTDRNRDSICLT
eukprot:PITA_31168